MACGCAAEKDGPYGGMAAADVDALRTEFDAHGRAQRARLGA